MTREPLTEEDLATFARLAEEAKLPEDTEHESDCPCPDCDAQVERAEAATDALRELRRLDAVGRLLAEVRALRARDVSMVNACNEIAEVIGEAKRQMDFDEEATIHDVLDSFRSTASELHECIEENRRLHAELAADRAASAALVEKLPRCEVHAGCTAHATRDWDSIGERRLCCDEHDPKMDHPYYEKYFYPIDHTASLRALQSRMAAWGDAEPAEPACDTVDSEADLAAHELDVARIRKVLETSAAVADPEDIEDAVDWPAFWSRRARLGKAAKAIEEPVAATVEWMGQEGGGDAAFVAAMSNPSPETLAGFRELAEVDRRHGLERAPEEQPSARPPLAEGQTWRLPCGTDVRIGRGPTGRLTGTGGNRYDVFFDTEAPAGWTLVSRPGAPGDEPADPPTRRELFSAPAATDDDEPSAYDAEVAERMAR